MRGVAPIGSRARRLLPATWVPLAAIAVHQLRFFLAYGDGGTRELAESGHSYLHSLTPWIVLLCALGAAALNRWSRQGIWHGMFYALTGHSGIHDGAAIDATHVKAHRSASGAKGGTSPRA